MFAACLSLLILLTVRPAPSPVPTPPATNYKVLTGDTDAPAPFVTVVHPQHPVEPKNIQASLLKTFASYVGIHEEPMGSNNGPMVDRFNTSCGLDPKEHAPWCASCATYGYLQNGLPGRGAYSPSWFRKDKAVSRDQVEPADVALVWFASKGRYAHTIACVEKVTRSAGRVVQVTTLEGNTNAQGGREGDQFARRLRPADTVSFVRWWK